MSILKAGTYSIPEPSLVPPEGAFVLRCDRCGDDIAKAAPYYEINDDTFCWECGEKIIRDRYRRINR